MTYAQLLERLALNARSLTCSLSPEDCAAMWRVLQRRDEALKALREGAVVESSTKSLLGL